MGWLLPAAMVTSSILPSLLQKKQKGSSVSQYPLQTGEEELAKKKLLNFADTGELGNYKAGEGYTGKLGNYDMTGIESAGLEDLKSLMGSPIGKQQSMGRDQLAKLFTGGKFDPYSDKGTYSGFKKQTLREMEEGQDRLKQNMAMTGDLYSTATAKESGLLQERGQDILTGEMARLYQDYTNKQIGAIPWALQSDQLQLKEKGMNEDIAMGRIDRSQEYGGLQRLLEDAKAKDMYSDWMRGRGEKENQVKALQSIISTPTKWGAQNVTVPGSYQPSPWSDVMNKLLDIGGKKWLQGGGQTKDTITDHSLEDDLTWAD